ncbi:MAG: ribokinase, partial [Bacilli bacterium]|nr:ribokinase [Bacilli bacterium]
YMVNQGIKNVIVTLGDKGSLLVNKDEVIKVEPHKVDAVDTTAAGDSYLGAFVTALSEGKNVKEAMEFASKVSSITVTRKGAIASLPSLEEIK